MNVCKVCGGALKTCTCEQSLAACSKCSSALLTIWNYCPYCGGAGRMIQCVHGNNEDTCLECNPTLSHDVLEAVPEWGVELVGLVLAYIGMIREQNRLCFRLIERVAKLEAALSKLHDIDNEPIFEPEPYPMEGG